MRRKLALFESAATRYNNVHRRTRGGGARCYAPPPPPPWLCNKVLKPNFQSMISQTNNDCSLLSFTLTKLLLLNVSCKNNFALFIVTALSACPYSIKKCAKMSVFYVKTAKIRWRLGATLSDPLSLWRVSPIPQILGFKSWVRHCICQMRSAPAVNRTRHEGSVTCSRCR